MHFEIFWNFFSGFYTKKRRDELNGNGSKYPVRGENSRIFSENSRRREEEKWVDMYKCTEITAEFSKREAQNETKNIELQKKEEEESKNLEKKVIKH